MDPASARRVLGEVPFWFHTFALNIAEGIYTPGVAVDHRYRLPFLPASFATLRVLDVGTFDGFYAFVAEARGAKRVVAVDSEQHVEWVRARWGYEMKGGEGFRAIARLLGSRVEYHRLEASRLGELSETFDFIFSFGILHRVPDPLGLLRILRARLADAAAACCLRHTGSTAMMAAARASACIDLGTSIPTTSSSIGALAQKGCAASPSWRVSQGSSCTPPRSSADTRGSSRRSHTPPTNSDAPRPDGGRSASPAASRSSGADIEHLVEVLGLWPECMPRGFGQSADVGVGVGG